MPQNWRYKQRPTEELIDRWETARAEGCDINPEDLCREHPELLLAVREQIAALKWMPSPHSSERSGSDEQHGSGADAHVLFTTGTVLANRYRLVEPVGEGGFGSVWRAFDTELQRTVEIKIPREARAGWLTNERFMAEARRLAQLRHSGIVPVFDVGRHDDVVFVVSEFIDGHTLTELPTGSRPFVAESPAELRHQIVTARPVSPRELNRQISPRLSGVCLRALARDPADRFASVLGMADAVRGAASSPQRRPVMVVLALTGMTAIGVAVLVATGRMTWRPDARDSSQQRESTSQSQAEPAALASGLAPESRSATDNEDVTANTAAGPSEHATVAVTAPVSVESSLVLRGHTGVVSCLSISADGRHVLSGSWDKTLRLWDAHTGESIREFSGHTEGIGGIALSPDGSRAASGAGHVYRDATLRIWDVDSAASLHQFKGHAHNIMAVAWAPNGEFLVTGSLDNTIRHWQPQANPQMTLLGSVKQADNNRWAGQVWAVAISPGSSRVLAGLRDHTMRLIDAQSGRQLLSLGGHTDQVRSVAFSQSGTQCLSGSLDGTVRLWDLNTGETHFQFHPDLGALNTAIFGPHESTILTGGQHHSFTMLDIKTDRLLARFTGHSEPIVTLALHPSGTVFSGSQDSTVRRWSIPAAAATN